MHIRFEGALDALSVGDVGPTIEKVVAESPKSLTVDLGAVTLLDSRGVGVIVSLFKRITEQGGQMRVVGAHDQPLVVLKVLELDEVFGC
jgi:anti-sigma B factor antagonist